MKVLSLISTALITLSLVGAVQAKPDTAHLPKSADVAPATIVLAHCEASDPMPCGINGMPAAKPNEADANILPTNAKRRVQNEPATPVPEPQTFIMMMLGLVVLGFASRRGGSEKFSE